MRLVRSQKETEVEMRWDWDKIIELIIELLNGAVPDVPNPDVPIWESRILP